MNKRYSSHRGRKIYKRKDSGRGWKSFCVFGLLVGIALMCNVFFHDQIEDFRRSISGGLERGGYSKAMSAIGSAINGEQTFTEAWSEAIAAISHNDNNVTPASSDVAPMNVNHSLLGSGEIAYDLLKNGVYYALPDDTGAFSSGSIDDEAVITFDFLETIDEEEVKAYSSGVVIADGDSTLYGKYLIIDHSDMIAQYFNCGELKVQSGDYVTEGQVIAEAP